jgi:mono/diheme cytochrome c family protein
MISARVVLGAAVAFCPFALACGNSPERERLDFERMRLQQRYDLYGKSGVFANHQSMQAPPPGTVTRESALDTGAIGTGMSGGQLVASVPLSLTPAQLVRGERKFTIYCAVCHGDGGFGGSIVAENMGPPRPPSLRSDSLAARPDGYIFDVATHGKGRMPAYAVELTPTERWAVIGYIRMLQQSRTLTPAQRADSVRAAAIHSNDSLFSETSRAAGAFP